jgi:hypothetical protein
MRTRAAAELGRPAASRSSPGRPGLACRRAGCRRGGCGRRGSAPRRSGPASTLGVGLERLVAPHPADQVGGLLRSCPGRAGPGQGHGPLGRRGRTPPNQATMGPGTGRRSPEHLLGGGDGDARRAASRPGRAAPASSSKKLIDSAPCRPGPSGRSCGRGGPGSNHGRCGSPRPSLLVMAMRRLAVAVAERLAIAVCGVVIRRRRRECQQKQGLARSGRPPRRPRSGPLWRLRPPRSTSPDLPSLTFPSLIGHSAPQRVAKPRPGSYCPPRPGPQQRAANLTAICIPWFKSFQGRHAGAGHPFPRREGG